MIDHEPGRLRLLPALMLAACAAGGSATGAPSGERFLRVVEDGERSVALEIATREYVAANGEGPVIGLVGVAHIGDRSFYRDIQTLLETYDIVLYESVMPPGARGPGGETEQERRASTEAALVFVASMIEGYRVERGRYPTTLEDAVAFAGRADPRLGDWTRNACNDGWGRDAGYRVAEDGSMFVLRSAGADGTPGGQGDDADVIVTDAHTVEAFEPASEDGLQSELASALGLDFQLTALDYSGERWRCSDMTVDELDRALSSRGVDFAPLQGSLAGTSLSARVTRVLLRLLRVADMLLDGAITDTAKVLMIEMLGDESIVEQSLEQFDPGFAEVIVGERNQVVVDDLETMLKREPDVRRIAVLYGAAHMADLAERLSDQLDYVPGEATWLRAIEVDLTQSAVSAQDLQMMRTMLKQGMRR